MIRLVLRMSAWKEFLVLVLANSVVLGTEFVDDEFFDRELMLVVFDMMLVIVGDLECWLQVGVGVHCLRKISFIGCDSAISC